MTVRTSSALMKQAEVTMTMQMSKAVMELAEVAMTEQAVATMTVRVSRAMMKQVEATMTVRTSRAMMEQAEATMTLRMSRAMTAQAEATTTRFLIPLQAKLVAVIRHRKRGRLKPGTVANDSIEALVQEALATDSTLPDAFASHAEQRSTGCRGTSFLAVAVALSVAGIVATDLVLNAAAAIQAGDSNTALFSQ